MVPKKKHFLIISLMSFLSIFLLIPISSAAEEQSPGTYLAIKEVLPENQSNPDVSYYDLKMSPGQKQTIEIEVFNTSDKEIKGKISVNPGKTTDTGSIDYGESEKIDSSMKFSISDLVKPENETFILAGNSSEKLKLVITMPEEEFDGIVIGGIQVTTADDSAGQDSSDSDQGMAIVNKIALVKGLVLRENSNDVKEDMKLLEVKAGQVMLYNNIIATLQNPTQALIEEISYEAKVTKKGQSEVLYETTVTDYRFAPTTQFNLNISLGSERFKAGDYHLKLFAKSQASGNEWTFEDDFTITANEAKKLNEKAVGAEEEPINWLLYGLIAGGVLLLLIVLVVVIVTMKKRKAEKKRSRKKRKNKKRSSKKNSSVRK